MQPVDLAVVGELGRTIHSRYVGSAAHGGTFVPLVSIRITNVQVLPGCATYGTSCASAADRLPATIVFV